MKKRMTVGKVRKMRILRRNKIWFYVGIPILVVIGVSYAYWSSALSHQNVLEADTVSGEIAEDFDVNSQPSGTVPKDVKFENTGSAAAFLRVAYSESWEYVSDNEGSRLLSNTVNGRDVAVKNWAGGFADGSMWERDDDGWYYYKKMLQPGEKTGSVLKSVTFPSYEGDLKEYARADYRLYFRMELLQASDSSASLNSDEVNRNASENVFGKVAVVDAQGNVTWK